MGHARQATARADTPARCDQPERRWASTDWRPAGLRPALATDIPRSSGECVVDPGRSHQRLEGAFFGVLARWKSLLWFPGAARARRSSADQSVAYARSDQT